MPSTIARTMPGRDHAAATMIAVSRNAVPAVVQPSPIRSMTGPCASEPSG